MLKKDDVINDMVGDSCILDRISNPKTIKIIQILSAAGRTKDQIATLRGLGLKKIGAISELENTSSIRGMIRKVKHLIKIYA